MTQLSVSLPGLDLLPTTASCHTACGNASGAVDGCCDSRGQTLPAQTH